MIWNVELGRYSLLIMADPWTSKIDGRVLLCLRIIDY
jgi:hypothetical protein